MVLMYLKGPTCIHTINFSKQGAVTQQFALASFLYLHAPIRSTFHIFLNYLRSKGERNKNLCKSKRPKVNLFKACLLSIIRYQN